MGNDELMRTHDVDVQKVGTKAAATVVHVAIDGQHAGDISLQDAVRTRPQAPSRNCTGTGVAVVMATGDAQGPHGQRGRALSIDAYHAGVKPDDKLMIVEELQDDGRMVAMAGDGINDAPALAQSRYRDRDGNRQ